MTAKSHNHTPERVALFTGSFDPFTIGHASVVERALPLFDHIIIAVGDNATKRGGSPIDERCQAISQLYADQCDRISVEKYSGELTVDAAKRLGAGWILRGVRSVKDFEYEREMADVNRRLTGIETIILFSLPEHGSISSSLVRELNTYGKDTSEFLPSYK